MEFKNIDLLPVKDNEKKLGVTLQAKD